MEEAGEKMAAADPLAEIVLTFHCPVCEGTCQESLDLPTFLWAETGGAGEAAREGSAHSGFGVRLERERDPGASDARRAIVYGDGERMKGYLQRMAASAVRPQSGIHPLVGSIYAGRAFADATTRCRSGGGLPEEERWITSPRPVGEQRDAADRTRCFAVTRERKERVARARIGTRRRRERIAPEERIDAQRCRFVRAVSSRGGGRREQQVRQRAAMGKTISTPMRVSNAKTARVNRRLSASATRIAQFARQ